MPVKTILMSTILISLLFINLFGNFPINSEKPFPDRVEISEYQGIKLGSSEDFRENSIKGVQRIDPISYKLKLDGLVKSEKEYSLTDLEFFDTYKKVVTLNCVEGWSVTVLWEGIKLEDLFEDTGIAENANTVIFYAYDGYTTSLPLDFIIDHQIIIADKLNDNTLREENGFPFQLVAEDKWGYKWIKWITRIELSNDPEYRGYWESLGYSNKGTYGEPQLESSTPEYSDPYLK